MIYARQLETKWNYLMPRRPRVTLPGYPHHIIQRGSNRQAVFKAKLDYQNYLQRLYDSLEKYECYLHAYVLMTNHIHLIITPPEENSIPNTMKRLGSGYASYFNHCYWRTGPLFEGRYKSAVIESEQYLLTCMKYIELNPVRAGIVKNPSEYRWSSFHANALGEHSTLVTPHTEYLRLGDNKEKRLRSYLALYETSLDEQALHTIREGTYKNTVLGSADFKIMIAKKVSTGDGAAAPSPMDNN